MKTYYLRQLYFATGEGAINIVAVGQSENKEDFINLCSVKCIDPYFLQGPLVFVEIEDLSNEEKEMIKNNYPTLYKRLKDKKYEIGSFWWSNVEHLNMA